MIYDENNLQESPHMCSKNLKSEEDELKILKLDV